MANTPLSAGDITEQLRVLNEGSPFAQSDALLGLVYDELRRQARRYLRSERGGHTLQTTALVHEAYLKLARQEDLVWQNRSHFFAIAARLMRQILIDHARTKQRAKRGGAGYDVSIEKALTVADGTTDFDLLALDEALTRLDAKEKLLAKIVELRFFSGLSVEETAEVLGVSESTVKRDWQMAKAWLRRELTP